MIVTTKELEAALAMLETLFPDMGIMLSVFNEDDGRTVANCDDASVSTVIENMYKTHVKIPASTDA